MNSPEDRRGLSDEDVELWLEVTRGVARRPGVRPPEPGHRPRKDSKAAAAHPAPVASPKRASRLPELAPLERRARQKLARGNLPIDAAIDLHGLHQPEAHRALHAFLSRAQREGGKIVLVVTGKGETRPAEGFETGVLRRVVPLWLKAPEWRGLVVGFEEAGRPHGGSGALYVRLRRGERRGA